MVGFLPSPSGILADAISIASSSLQEIQSISLASLLQYPLLKAVVRSCSAKKNAIKNFAKFTNVSSGARVSYEFWEILNEIIFLLQKPIVAAFFVCTIRDFLF